LRCPQDAPGIPTGQVGNRSSLTNFCLSLPSQILVAFQQLTHKIKGGAERDLPSFELRTHPIQEATQEQSTTQALYLLLCLNGGVGASKVRLQQPPVHDLESDKKLFSLLRTNYNFHRKRWWSFLSLWELQRIDFVHFEMYDGPLIDIKEIHSLPPQEHNTTYLYDRPILNPPIGTNLLMHYLRCPHEASSKTPCLEKMPKKMNDKLNVCPIKGISPGWGLYFV